MTKVVIFIEACRNPLARSYRSAQLFWTIELMEQWGSFYPIALDDPATPRWNFHGSPSRWALIRAHIRDYPRGTRGKRGTRGTRERESETDPSYSITLQMVLYNTAPAYSFRLNWRFIVSLEMGTSRKHIESVHFHSTPIFSICNCHHSVLFITWIW